MRPIFIGVLVGMTIEAGATQWHAAINLFVPIPVLFIVLAVVAILLGARCRSQRALSKLTVWPGPADVENSRLGWSQTYRTPTMRGLSAVF